MKNLYCILCISVVRLYRYYDKDKVVGHRRKGRSSLPGCRIPYVGDGFYLNTVPAFKVRDQETPVPFLLDDLDFGKFVYFELLIFWRMGIIESPLLSGIYLQIKLINQQFC